MALNNLLPTSSRKQELVACLCICAATLLVFFLTVQHSRNNRRFSPVHQVATIPTMDGAYGIWASAGVRGRVLVYCDRRLNIEVSEPVDPSSPGDQYVYASIRTNMVRVLYHVVPDSAWDEVATNLRKFPVYAYDRGMFRITVFDGIPLYVMRLRDMPHLDEEVLLHINSDVWDDREFSEILGLLHNHTLSGDIITLSGASSATRAKALQTYAISQ